MDENKDLYGLSKRRNYDRLVSKLRHLIDSRSVEFRFFRGGAFRATVIREKLDAVLIAVNSEREQFNRALSEIVSYANAIVFKTESDLINRPEMIGPVRPQIADQDLPGLKVEIRERLDVLKETVDFSEIGARAKLRRYALASTIDSLSWSISRGSITSSENETSEFEAASITFSLFRPVGAKNNDSQFSLLTDLIDPPAETFSFVADEHDIGEIIKKLNDIRKLMEDRKI